jgi:DNA polymerase-3 subunit epsilon
MRFAIIDIETTGGNPKNGKITEIAIFIIENNEIVDSFVSLVNPGVPIPYFIVNLTGINDQMVASAPSFPEIAKKILEITEGCIFVAHNVGFDYSMVRAEYKSLGYIYSRPTLCTVKLSRIILPGHDSYSLGKLARDLNIQVQGRHRAGGDALATAEIFKLLLAKNSSLIESQTNAQKKSFQDNHPLLDIDAIDELPNKVGVYLLFNEFNQIIYIGKSKHIRKRVVQHLSNTKTKKGAKMRTEITRIEIELTGSEVVALLRESQLIKAHQPIYNRVLRKNIFPIGLFCMENQLGYKELYISNLSKKIELPHTVFSTQIEANNYLHEKVKEHTLCQKMCQLYQSNDACFGYQISECKGACIRAETSEEYNLRVDAFLDSLHFSKDNFYVIEQGRTKNEKALICIQNNSFRGFTFVPFYVLQKPVREWIEFIDVSSEDKNSKLIIQNYLRQNKKANIVQL